MTTSNYTQSTWVKWYSDTVAIVSNSSHIYHSGETSIKSGVQSLNEILGLHLHNSQTLTDFQKGGETTCNNVMWLTQCVRPGSRPNLKQYVCSMGTTVSFLGAGAIPVGCRKNAVIEPQQDTIVNPLTLDNLYAIQKSSWKPLLNNMATCTCLRIS